ncbi:MAG: N-acetylmuramoyl-L-alanine amidase [Ekhidna sp.]
MSIQYRTLAIILSGFIDFSVFAQKPYQQKQSLEAVEHFQVHTTDSIFVFEFEKPFSALVFTSSIEASYFVEIDDEWIIVPKDDDVSDPTYFISLPNLTKEIRIKAPSEVIFDLYAISSGESPSIDQRSRTSVTQDCAEPLDVVLQSDWRGGLQSPSYGRSFHDVSHNVVHHSAGSNSNSNYTQVVRDIYLYHTQVNGWSDIGYNYLIAQNGIIYAGRDPAGGSQDEVRGAHFCGSNSNTLGVCLLGNYETAEPSASMFTSLKELLTYQLLNQELDPFDLFNHPLGDIGTIAGHRDGCATLCPGENVYSQMELLKSDIDLAMQNCLDEPRLAFSVNVDSTMVEELISFSNESVLYDSYQWIFEGGFPSQSSSSSPTVSYSVPGVYDVTLIGVKEDLLDTLLKNDFIYVGVSPESAVLYPNPAQANGVIRIESEDYIQKLEMYQMNGKVLIQSFNKTGLIVPNVTPGIYFVSIYSESGISTRKLVVN